MNEAILKGCHTGSIQKKFADHCTYLFVDKLHEDWSFLFRHIEYGIHFVVNENVGNIILKTE